MKMLKRVSNEELWNLCYILARMMQSIHMYFARELNINKTGEPYNHINDGIEGQSDFMTSYLELKEILDPYFDSNKVDEKIGILNELTFLVKKYKK